MKTCLHRQARIPNPESRTPRLKTSPPFLKDRDRLLYLAEVAKRAHCRPSELLELEGMPAYLVDCAAAETAAARERGEFDAPENVIDW